ncbi:MAG TPA: TetR family transcriptional regulator [bacterium]
MVRTQRDGIMQNLSTREKIKSAATEAFIEKGYDGARMQDIADRAGANKAMIHYYFQSKDRLFESILRETFEDLFERFSRLKPPAGSFSPEEIVPQIVRTHMRFLQEHPELPKLLVREMHTGNPVVKRVMGDLLRKVKRGVFSEFSTILRIGALAGRVRRIDPRNTIWSLIGMNLFFFVARPVLEAGWPELFKDEDRLLKDREKAVADLFLYGILPRKK